MLMEQDGIEVHKGAKEKKKRTRPISSHLDRTSLVSRRFLIWINYTIFLWDKVDNLEQAKSDILPVRAVNQSTGFGSSFPFTDLVVK